MPTPSTHTSDTTDPEHPSHDLPEETYGAALRLAHNDSPRTDDDNNRGLLDRIQTLSRALTQARSPRTPTPTADANHHGMMTELRTLANSLRTMGTPTEPHADDVAEHDFLNARIRDVNVLLKEHNKVYADIIERMGAVHDHMKLELAQLHKDVQLYAQNSQIHDRNDKESHVEMERMLAKIKEGNKSLNKYLENVLQSIKVRNKLNDDELRGLAGQAELIIQMDKSLVGGDKKSAIKRMGAAEAANAGVHLAHADADADTHYRSRPNQHHRPRSKMLDDDDSDSPDQGHSSPDDDETRHSSRPSQRHRTRSKLLDDSDESAVLSSDAGDNDATHSQPHPPKPSVLDVSDSSDSSDGKHNNAHKGGIHQHQTRHQTRHSSEDEAPHYHHPRPRPHAPASSPKAHSSSDEGQYQHQHPRHRTARVPARHTTTDEVHHHVAPPQKVPPLPLAPHGDAQPAPNKRRGRGRPRSASVASRSEAEAAVTDNEESGSKAPAAKKERKPKRSASTGSRKRSASAAGRKRSASAASRKRSTSAAGRKRSTSAANQDRGRSASAGSATGQRRSQRLSLAASKRGAVDNKQETGKPTPSRPTGNKTPKRGRSKTRSKSAEPTSEKRGKSKPRSKSGGRPQRSRSNSKKRDTSVGAESGAGGVASRTRGSSSGGKNGRPAPPPKSPKKAPSKSPRGKRASSAGSNSSRKKASAGPAQDDTSNVRVTRSKSKAMVSTSALAVSDSDVDESDHDSDDKEEQIIFDVRPAPTTVCCDDDSPHDATITGGGLHALLHEGILCLNSQVDMTHDDLDEITHELLELVELPFPTSGAVADRQAVVLRMCTQLYDSVSQVAMEHNVDAEDVYTTPSLMQIVLRQLAPADQVATCGSGPYS